jgi:hypothetical protein
MRRGAFFFGDDFFLSVICDGLRKMPARIRG